VVTSLERAGGTACPTYADAEPVLVAQAVPPARLSCYCPRGGMFDLPGLTGYLNASLVLVGSERLNVGLRPVRLHVVMAELHE